MSEAEDRKTESHDPAVPFDLDMDLGSMRDTLDDTVSKSSRNKKSKRTRGERDMIKHISIADSATGLVLFEKSFNWAQNAQTSMLGSLVQSFYQFAREVDDGGISSINFETHAPMRHRRQTSSNFRARAVRVPSDTMKMVCIKGVRVSISVFYDMKGGLLISDPAYERLRTYMNELHTRFENTYVAALDSCKDEIKAAAEAPAVDEEQMSTIRSNFVLFESVVESLRDDIFPAANMSMSSVTTSHNSMQRTSSGLTNSLPLA